MNIDIRLSVSFKGHRKRRKLRLLLGDNSTDYLIDLWITVAQDRPTGVLIGWSQTDIALAAGWEGDAAQFVAALVNAGLLEEADGIYRLHDWEEHQPWVCKAPQRSEAGRRGANARWEKCGPHAVRMPTAYEAHAESNADSMRFDAPNPNPNPNPIPEDKSIYSPIPEESDNTRSEKAAIFDHWNKGAGITHRKMTDKIRRSISGALGNYTEVEITTAIDNYSRIITSTSHYFKYKWTLSDFLQRGLDKFIDWRVCDANYKKDNGKATLPDRDSYTPTVHVEPLDTTGLTTPQINEVLMAHDGWTVRQAVAFLRSKA